jgi:hypothetical protein
MGDGSWEMGVARWEMGDGSWEMGVGSWEKSADWQGSKIIPQISNAESCRY